MTRQKREPSGSALQMNCHCEESRHRRDDEAVF